MDAKTKQDFLDTLNKVKFEPTPAMQAGIDFENEVEKYTLGDSETKSECVIEFGELLIGSIWQEKVRRELKIGEFDLLLYGRTDAIKRNTVYDVKFTKNYTVGKFESSIQHWLYLYCSRLKEFEYLVSNGKANYVEFYTWSENSLELLSGRIADMLQDIFADKEFKESFIKNWSAK